MPRSDKPLKTQDCLRVWQWGSNALEVCNLYTNSIFNPCCAQAWRQSQAIERTCDVTIERTYKPPKEHGHIAVIFFFQQLTKPPLCTNMTVTHKLVEKTPSPSLLLQWLWVQLTKNSVCWMLQASELRKQDWNLVDLLHRFEKALLFSTSRRLWRIHQRVQFSDGPFFDQPAILVLYANVENLNPIDLNTIAFGAVAQWCPFQPEDWMLLY